MKCINCILRQINKYTFFVQRSARLLSNVCIQNYAGKQPHLHRRYPHDKNHVPITTKAIDQSLQNHLRLTYATTIVKQESIDSATFEKVCEETLESLSEYFEEIVENASYLKAADVSYSSGVLSVALGESHGTYVINRQSPNKQIWLSSPISGPKRYDFVSEGRYWIYKHDGQTLHQLLQEEISKIIEDGVDFARCSYAFLPKS